MVLDWILRLFSSDLTVRVSPETFTFSTGKGAVTLQTHLTLSRSTQGLRIVAVGEWPPPSATTFTIQLFSIEGTDEPGVDRLELLEAFCRYGIQKLHDRRALVRPETFVHGAASLDRIFNGWQY